MGGVEQRQQNDPLPACLDSGCWRGIGRRKSEPLRVCHCRVGWGNGGDEDCAPKSLCDVFVG